MKLKLLSLFVFLIACGETQVDRTEALRAASALPVPVLQSSSDGVDFRGRPLSGRSLVEEYLSSSKTLVSGITRTIPFVGDGRFGQLQRVDGPSGTLAFFVTNNSFGSLGAGSQNSPKEQGRIISEQVAARTGCSWTGETIGKYSGSATFAVFLTC